MIPKQPLMALSIAMLAFAGTIQADSAKLVYPNNGHAYQRFDVTLNWADAKTVCVNLGAYLATITSQQENEWIRTNLTVGVNNTWLGGTDVGHVGTWTWITGEPWNYTNWNTGEPNFPGIEDYLEIYGTGYWNNRPGYPATSEAYICEWDASQYLDVTAIPDLNGDGVLDQATLVLSLGNYYLRTIDSATGKQLKQVVLGSSKSVIPNALTLVGNKISILITQLTGGSVLKLYDSATLVLVKTLTLPK
jgi:hypothetical protein